MVRDKELVKEALDEPKEKKFHQVKSTFESSSQQLAPLLESLNYVVEALSLPKVKHYQFLHSDRFRLQQHPRSGIGVK